MSSLKNEKILMVLVVTVFAVAFAWLVALMNANNDLRRDLDYERLRGESLLSEKLLMEKFLLETRQLIKAVTDSINTAEEDRYEHAQQAPCSTAELKRKLTAVVDRLQSVSGRVGSSPGKVE